MANRTVTVSNLILLLSLLLNSYLGLRELLAQPYNLGLMVLIKLVNNLLPFLYSFNICGNIAPTLAHKGIEHFLYSCHGASCMQANDAEGRKNDRLKKEEKERI